MALNPVASVRMPTFAKADIQPVPVGVACAQASRQICGAVKCRVEQQISVALQDIADAVGTEMQQAAVLVDLADRVLHQWVRIEIIAEIKDIHYVGSQSVRAQSMLRAHITTVRASPGISSVSIGQAGGGRCWRGSIHGVDEFRVGGGSASARRDRRHIQSQCPKFDTETGEVGIESIGGDIGVDCVIHLALQLQHVTKLEMTICDCCVQSERMPVRLLGGTKVPLFL